MSQAYSIAANVVPMAALVGSVAVLFWLFQKHVDGRPLLAYEPRRPVPWNAAAPALLLAVILAPAAIGMLSAVGLLSDLPAALPPPDAATIGMSTAAAAVVGGPLPAIALTIAEPATAEAWSIAPPPELRTLLLWGQAGTFVIFALLSHVVLASLFGATRADLGWPADWAQTRRDVGIGCLTFLAVLAPVYAIQLALVVLFAPETGHPLIERLHTEHSPGMLVAAFAVAVIGAPLFEETAFRLVLQGWLERVQSLGRGMSLNSPEDTRFEAANLHALGGIGDSNGYTSAEPANGSWAPIVISGVLFALAHLGQGVAPASLLPLGLALGYVYQRTHRIVPSMVCHALFNAFSLLILWLALAAETP